jgi:hypothetical protein
MAMPTELSRLVRKYGRIIIIMDLKGIGYEPMTGLI